MPRICIGTFVRKAYKVIFPLRDGNRIGSAKLGKVEIEEIEEAAGREA
ncbi:MAG: hypothetical protein ACUVTD_05795 [Nitrososphaerales archaeon]